MWPMAYPTTAATMPIKEDSIPLTKTFPTVSLAFMVPSKNKKIVEKTIVAIFADCKGSNKKGKTGTSAPMKADINTVKKLDAGFAESFNGRCSSSDIIVSTHTLSLEIIFFTILF